MVPGLCTKDLRQENGAFVKIDSGLTALNMASPQALPRHRQSWRTVLAQQCAESGLDECCPHRSWRAGFAQQGSEAGLFEMMIRRECFGQPVLLHRHDG